MPPWVYTQRVPPEGALYLAACKPTKMLERSSR